MFRAISSCTKEFSREAGQIVHRNSTTSGIHACHGLFVDASLRYSDCYHQMLLRHCGYHGVASPNPIESIQVWLNCTLCPTKLPATAANRQNNRLHSSTMSTQ
eukprot:3660830-Amphidinium_carterae.1